MSEHRKYRGKHNGGWKKGFLSYNFKTNEYEIVNSQGVWPVIPESVGQSTGIEDYDIWEGDIIQFILCFPTSQTHYGDNSPRGEYTEPDEPFFHKITARVVWDEYMGRWTYSVIGDCPYGFSQMPTWHDETDLIPLIWREQYSIEYIKSLCPHCKNQSDCNPCEYLVEAGVSSWDELAKVLNKITVIGNTTDNPKLLEQENE